MSEDADRLEPAQIQRTREEGPQDWGWQSRLARPVLIALLATCMMAGPLTLAAVFFYDPRLNNILALCFVAALLAVYTTQWTLKPAQRQLHRLAFRLGEAILILIFVRVVTWLLTGDLPTLEDARQWVLDPLSFFDGYYAIAALLALFAWDRASVFADIFHRLALAPDELAWYHEQRVGGWRRRIPVEYVRTPRQALVGQFATAWILGGALLVLTAGLSRVRIPRGALLRLTELSIPPQLIVAIIAYFLIGLVLASQARLAMLRAQWLFDGVEGAPDIPERWQRISLAIVLGLGLLATLLPLGSTWRLGEMLGLVIGVLGRLVYTIFFGLFSLLVWLLSQLGMAGQPMEELPPPEMVPGLAEEAVAPTFLLPPWLPGAGFWLITLVIVALAIRYVLSQQNIRLTRAELSQALGRLGERLRLWWMRLRQRAGGLQLQLRRPSLAATGTEDAARRRPWSFIRLGGLPPREKIRYFYLSTVRRAASSGVQRRPSQTPREFVQDLEAHWPEAEIDLEALTYAFEGARYDQSEIGEPEAQQVKGIWERVKHALRGKRGETQA